MKKKFVLIACVVAFACACQQKSADTKNENGNGQKMMDDQNYQDRRKQMQQPQKSCGSCEAEKVEKADAPQQSATVATPEVKVEKAQ